MFMSITYYLHNVGNVIVDVTVLWWVFCQCNAENQLNLASNSTSAQTLFRVPGTGLQKCNKQA